MMDIWQHDAMPAQEFHLTQHAIHISGVLQCHLQRLRSIARASVMGMTRSYTVARRRECR